MCYEHIDVIDGLGLFSYILLCEQYWHAMYALEKRFKGTLHVEEGKGANQNLTSFVFTSQQSCQAIRTKKPKPDWHLMGRGTRIDLIIRTTYELVLLKRGRIYKQYIECLWFSFAIGIGLNLICGR